MPIELVVDAALVEAFAEATGDYSSIHIDPHFARKTQFRGQIVHGMLPLLVVLVGVPTERGTNHRLRLAAVSCRFQGAVKLGERLRFTVDEQEGEDGRLHRSFQILRAESGEPITVGTAIFVNRDGEQVGSTTRAGMLREPASEARHTAADLKTGHRESLCFAPNPSVLQPVVDRLAAAGKVEEDVSAFVDANISALTLLSTLIGMRLPGRFATFLDFEAEFADEAAPDLEMTIQGVVARISPSAGRMTLDVTWTQGDRTLGTGTASTMIGAPEESSASCADIRTNHLALGLEGRVALVTGASRGIGEATAKALAMSGVRVAIHYFRGAHDAAAIVADIAGNGGQAFAVQADLRDNASVSAMFVAIESQFGAVDILVNNAVGDFTPKPVQDLSGTDFMNELDVTLIGMHACCRSALPHMRRQRWGKIINMGTVATEMPAASQAKYIAAKSAVVGYTRALAVETVDDNIQVNLVVPSMTQTSLIAGLPRALIARLAEDCPGGRLLSPIDVAKVILFLASDWATPLSGQQCVLSRGAAPFL